MIIPELIKTLLETDHTRRIYNFLTQTVPHWNNSFGEVVCSDFLVRFGDEDLLIVFTVYTATHNDLPAIEMR